MKLGALEISQGCITYYDPNTGAAIYDANSVASGQCLPADPGANQALADWASGTTQQISVNALNALQSAATTAGNDTVSQQAQTASGLCAALGIGCPTNIPSPLTPSTSLWLVIGLGLIGLAVLTRR